MGELVDQKEADYGRSSWPAAMEEVVDQLQCCYYGRSSWPAEMEDVVVLMRWKK